MRDHVIKEITMMGEKDANLFLLSGDLGYKVLDEFKEKCPRQFINVGIAEQNMTALAAGMALEGSTVFTYSIGNFPTLRCIEQIRNDICYNNAKVIILAVGGGFVYGNQGITHHATEDIAMMRVLPNMRVYVPGDAYEALECVKDAYRNNGPSYIRLARNREQNYHADEELIQIGKIQSFQNIENPEVCIFTAGSILCEGVKLKEKLNERGISTGLYSVPRIKPIDKETICNLSKKASLFVTIEEHQKSGGLGGLISEILAEESPHHAVLVRFGLDNCFSDITGSQEYLRHYYCLDADRIEQRVMELL